jgi:hypothetical protein
MVVFSLLSRSALAAESKWIPDAGLDPSACLNDYKFGTTRIVQCASGVPTTTQIAYNTYGRESSVTTAPKSWVSFQDHSVSLVPINASESTSGWFAPQTGFSSTNWGGNVGDLMAQGHMTWYGDKDGDDQQGTNAVRSGMSYGYISYTPKQVENLTLGENQFLVSAGGNTAYYLNGCPNYAPGNTSANMNYTCPRVPVKPGSYKFSIMGMLFGSMINSAHNASYPNYTESSSAHYRDLAQYKSLVLTTTLDVTNVGNASAKSAWVEFRNGTTVNFTDLTNTTDIAGTSLHFVSPGSGEDEIIMKFSDYYSTGNYTRDTAAIVTEFGAIPCDMSGGMDKCVRDNTGFGNSPDSFPMGGNVAVKKMGKGGMDALPNIDCGNGAGYPTASYSSACDVTSYAGATESPASTAEELAVAAGAPKLEVTEVRPVRVYMRPHGGCSGRPASPAANDPTGTLGTTWVNAPKDCPALVPRLGRQRRLEVEFAGGVPQHPRQHDDRLRGGRPEVLPHRHSLRPGVLGRDAHGPGKPRERRRRRQLRLGQGVLLHVRPRDRYRRRRLRLRQRRVDRRRECVDRRRILHAVDRRRIPRAVD